MSPKAESKDMALICVLALSVFPVLLVLQHLDDNSLTSWRWVFRFSDPAMVFFFHALGIAAAAALSARSFPERRPALFLFALSSLVPVLLWSEPEAIIDSSRYFAQAKHLGLYGARHFLEQWGGDVFAWTDLPLAPFVYGLAFRFLGESRIWIQALTTLMFSLTVVGTFFLGKRLWNEQVGFLGGLFLLGMPYLLTQVPLMLVDVPTMCFSTLSACIFLFALDRGGAGRVLLSSFVIVLTLLCKYSVWLFHGSLLAVIFLVLLAGKQRRAVLRRGLAVAVPAAVLFGLLVILKFETVEAQLALLRSYQWSGLKRWQESLFSTLCFQIHPFITLAAGASVFLAVGRRDPRFLIIAWMWIAAVLLQARRIRYLIPAMPMLALMAGYGLQLLGSPRLRRFCAWCAVSFSLVIALTLYLPFLRSMSTANLQRAGAYLNSLEGIRAARVFTSPQKGPLIRPFVAVPMFDLFTTVPVYTSEEGVLDPPPEKVARSAFRFTWEFGIPRYYRPPASPDPAGTAIVVISGPPTGPIESKSGYHEPVIFDRAAVFRFKTAVAVYVPVGVSP